MDEVIAVERRYRDLLEHIPPSRMTPDVIATGWLTEELRVSVFAQALGTSVPVSSKRIVREIDRLAAALAPSASASGVR
ncbi:DUF3418 domain-containing protein [Nostoc sp. HG1]|nr:DUF3418 domain-containing protein [Nostoc sp. HG1]